MLPVAEPTSASDQLRLFSQAIYNYASPGSPAPPMFTYATWRQAWEQASRLAEQHRMALLLDESTHLLEANPAVAGILQNAWDHLLIERQLMLVVSGSHLGMMQRHALSHQAPLYGRATAQLHLQPLPFGVTKAFFPGYNADRYGIDPDRIAALGGSAGGHLALMVAYTSDLPGLEPAAPYPGVSSEVRAVVDLYGPANLLTRQKTDAAGNPTGEVRLDSHLLSTAVAEDEAGWRRASPVSHVRPGLPPTLILHGTADTTVDRDQSHELARALEKAGVEHELILLPGVGHTFDLERWSGGPLPIDLRPVVIGFLDKYLRPEAPR